MTGRRWTRPERTHPDWCLRGYRCDAYDRSDGQHRSAPVTLSTPWGPLVYTHVQPRDRRRRLEMRVVVELDADAQVAAAQATAVTAGVDEVVRAALGRGAGDVRGVGRQPIGSGAWPAV